MLEAAGDGDHLQFAVLAGEGGSLADRARALLAALPNAQVREVFLAPLRAAGVEIAWFHPARLRWLWRPRVNLRNHRKVVVVDGRIGFTGGINITDEENERVRADAFHDLHLRLEGEVVRWLQLAFLEDWHYGTGTALRDEKLWPEPREGKLLAHALPSGPDSVWESIHRVKVEAIHQANQRVWLVTPYFVPGEAARMGLIDRCDDQARAGFEARCLQRALAPHYRDISVVVLPDGDRQQPVYRLTVKAPAKPKPNTSLSAKDLAALATLPPLPSQPTPQQVVAERLQASPTVMNTQYSLAEGAGSQDIVPTLIYDDGRFTYLRFPGNREIPAVFHVLGDGGETLARLAVGRQQRQACRPDAAIAAGPGSGRLVESDVGPDDDLDRAV